MSSTPFEGVDDVVLPFAVEPLDVRGRIVRLGSSIDTILSRHNYPDAVSRVLAEATALAVLLGSALKFEGRFQLQTKTDGPIEMIVVDFDAPDRLRATARFDRERLISNGAGSKTGDLIGSGYMAMTVERGAEQSRYQGVVALQAKDLRMRRMSTFVNQSKSPPRFVLR